MPLQSEAEEPGTLWGKALPLADGPKEPPIYKPNQRRAGFGIPVIIYYAYYMFAAVIRPAAEIFGLTEAELTEAAHQYKAAKAEATARETTTRATVETRPELSPGLVAALLKDSTLGQLQERLEKQLQEIELPEGGFTTIKQARAGSSLATTFYRLQKRREKLGLPPIEKPNPVQEAGAMAAQYYDHHTKTGEFIPPKPRGRPRKTAQSEPAPAA